MGCIVSIEFAFFRAPQKALSVATTAVARVVEWVAGTDLEVPLRTVISLENEAAKIAHALGMAKKALAKCFLD